MYQLRQRRSSAKPGPFRAGHVDLPMAGEVQDRARRVLGSLKLVGLLRYLEPGRADAAVLAAHIWGCGLSLLALMCSVGVLGVVAGSECPRAGLADPEHSGGYRTMLRSRTMGIFFAFHAQLGLAASAAAASLSR